LPLSAAQLGIWYAIKAGTSASAYSIAEYTRIFGSVDKGLFETALRQLISEVEVLRLRFFESDGAVRQRVAEPDEWRLSYLDVTREADPLRAAETWMQADAAESVSVEQWPLFGFALIKLRANEFLWFFRSHHLIMDGYSAPVVTRRLAEIYSAHLMVAAGFRRPHSLLKLNKTRLHCLALCAAVCHSPRQALGRSLGRRGDGMANAINKLSDRRIRTLGDPGRHSDGGGLYLIVDRPGGKDAARRWAFLFRQNGKLREMGLGGLNDVPLATARDLAAECRKTVALGGDPIADRKRKIERKREEERAKKTFGEVSAEFIESHEAEWSNAKHVAQWRMTVDVYAAALKPKPVAAITAEDVLAVLRPIWGAKPETASRLRGRIERILDAAKAAKLRTGDNPAEWKGNLNLWLAKRERGEDNHHGAMPYVTVPAFVERLREQPGLATRALEFVILTGGRSGEVLGATWGEVDIEEAVWAVPARRMKGKREHRVPLSDRAMAILAEVGKFKTSEFVFPGRLATAPLSNMALAMILRRMGAGDATVHGFRSSFRDWCGDKTTFPREVAEAALAHAIGDKTEAAYRREDALEKRRELMDAWARHCGGASGENIVRFQAARR